MSATTGISTRRVLVVDDHRMFREWLGRMIAEENEFAVCGEADNIRDALEIVDRENPDVIILDVTLRGSSGLELLKDMKARGISTPVLVLSMHEEALYAERALRAGARGYMTKHEASSTVLDALRAVVSGQLYMDKNAAAQLLKRFVKPRSEKLGGMESLSDRELEVFHLIGKGRSTRDIAKQLALGEATVETYRMRIKEKLDLKKAAELVSFAAQWVHEHGA